MHKYPSNIFAYFKTFHPRFHLLLNILFLIYAALLPFSDAFSSHTGPWLLLLFWLLEGNLPKKFRVLLNEKVNVWWLLFLGFSFLSLSWTSNIHDGMHILKYYFAIAIVMSTLYTSHDKKFAPWLIYTFLGAMFISEVISYGIYFDLWQTKRGSPQNPTPFMHHVIYSIFLAITIILLLGHIFNNKNYKWLRILELFFLLSVTGNLFINGGRTGQLAMILGIITFAVARYGMRIKTFALTLVILAGVFCGAYLLSPNFQNRISQGLSDIHNIQQGKLDNSWGYRVAMIEISLQNITQHPFIGNGIGDVKEAFRETLRKTSLKKYSFLQNVLHVHNQYLQITMQTGIIGLFLFLAFLISLFFEAKKFRKGQRSIFYGVLVIFLFSFFTDVPLRSYTSGLFGLVIGYFISNLPND